MPTPARTLSLLQERLALEMDRREICLGTIKFGDLDVRTAIGVGSFGQIRLAVHKPTNTPCAPRSLRTGAPIPPFARVATCSVG